MSKSGLYCPSFPAQKVHASLFGPPSSSSVSVYLLWVHQKTPWYTLSSWIWTPPSKPLEVLEQQHKQISSNSVEIKDIQDQPPMDISTFLCVLLNSHPAITRPELSSQKILLNSSVVLFSLSFWCLLFVFLSFSKPLTRTFYSQKIILQRSLVSVFFIIH